MFFQNACRRIKSPWIVIALGLAVYSPCAAQSLNGFGLPQPSQPRKYSAPIKPLSPEVKPLPEFEKYIERVKAVRGFLRARYGFGFGDTQSTVEANNLLDVDVISGGAFGPHAGNFDYNWTVKGSKIGTVSVAFYVDSYANIVMLFDGIYSTTPPQNQGTRLLQEEIDLVSLLTKSGMTRSLDVTQKSWEYKDPGDPCHLVVDIPKADIPMTVNNAGFYKWSFLLWHPSKQCIDSLG